MPKAKELRRFAEKIITKAKKGGVSAIRNVNADIYEKDVTAKIFSELVKRYETRNGGYTRILKLGRYRCDGAELVIIQLVQ